MASAQLESLGGKLDTFTYTSISQGLSTFALHSYFITKEGTDAFRVFGVNFLGACHRMMLICQEK
jgi:hypothetical protein